MITTCRSDHHPPIHVLHTLLPAVALVPRAAWALCGNSSARRSEIIRESARESTSDTTLVNALCYRSILHAAANDIRIIDSTNVITDDLFD